LWVALNIERFHYNMPIRGTGSKEEKRCQELFLFRVVMLRQIKKLGYSADATASGAEALALWT
jgi:hypothetical protein